MGRNPNANWCVTRPWFDYVMGTREFIQDGPRESNVLGLPRLPTFIAQRLPRPESLAGESPAPVARAADAAGPAKEAPAARKPVPTRS